MDLNARAAAKAKNENRKFFPSGGRCWTLDGRRRACLNETTGDQESLRKRLPRAQRRLTRNARSGKLPEPLALCVMLERAQATFAKRRSKSAQLANHNRCTAFAPAALRPHRRA
eukprot:scaffold8783_cov135-Isochrysis_galbana.AAC.3